MGVRVSPPTPIGGLVVGDGVGIDFVVSGGGEDFAHGLMSFCILKIDLAPQPLIF